MAKKKELIKCSVYSTLFFLFQYSIIGYNQSTEGQEIAVYCMR